MPSMGTDKMPVRPGRPCAAMAMATRLMAETGMMMPASGSDGSCWSKVAEMQQLRMPPHERQWSTTLLALSRSRTPPSRSQHIDSRSLEDRVAAGISLLGRGCGALGAERGNKTSERLFRPFCPLLDPPRFRTCLVGATCTWQALLSPRFPFMNSATYRSILREVKSGPYMLKAGFQKGSMELRTCVE